MQFDSLKRRDFITLLGGAAATCPMAARAQQGERARQIGVLMTYREGDPEVQSWLVTFRRRLRELGWSDGDNIRIEVRLSGGDADRLRANASELVSLKSDVIYAIGTPVVAALQQATHTIPIVFVNAQNPVGSGFVTSLARPGGNITGFVSFEPSMGGKWLETLKEVAPGIVRVAALYNPKTHTGQYWSSIESAARAMSLAVMRTPFLDADEIERALAYSTRESKGGLLVLPDTSTSLYREIIIGQAARHRLPAVYPFRNFVSRGGLAYYGIDSAEQNRQAASYVARILKGEKPGDLPVQAPTKFELVINVKTAKALGLDVPPTLLARADEVIE